MSELAPEVIAGIVISSIALIGLTSYGLYSSSKKNANAHDDEMSSLSDLNRFSAAPLLGDVFPQEYSGLKGRNAMNNKNVNVNTNKNTVREIPPEGKSNPVIQKSTTRKSTTRKSMITGGKRKSKKSRKTKKRG